MFECIECGKTFRTTRAAEKATEDGCPICGGVDIDVQRVERVTMPDSDPVATRKFFTQTPRVLMSW